MNVGAFLKAAWMGFQVFLELWPIIKDPFIESPDEFRASVHEVLGKLREAKKLPWEERREAYRKTARDFAEHIRRRG